MSEMQLVVAIRFSLKTIEKSKLVTELTEIFGKAPDEIEEYDGEVEYFQYDYKLNDGFAVNVIDNQVFADYILADNDDCDINLDISDKQIKEIVDLANKKGFEYSEYKIKVLYYYNGGCAGLSEVK